jgi:hypothetical protein
MGGGTWPGHGRVRVSAASRPSALSAVLEDARAFPLGVSRCGPWPAFRHDRHPHTAAICRRWPQKMSGTRGWSPRPPRNRIPRVREEPVKGRCESLFTAMPFGGLAAA